MDQPRPRLTPAGYLVDGRLYPRVTSVLGVLAKPSLEAWKHSVGLAEAERVSAAARELGTRIHAALEMVNRGAPAPCVGDVAPFVAAYRRWFDTQVVGVIAAERFLVHRRHEYAGTCDVVVRLHDSALALLDFKSSQRADPTWPLQLAAYSQAWTEMGEEPIERRIVVNLPSRRPGVLRLFEYDDHERDDRAWRAALRCWRYMARRADDWKLPGMVVYDVA